MGRKAAKDTLFISYSAKKPKPIPKIQVFANMRIPFPPFPILPSIILSLTISALSSHAHSATQSSLKRGSSLTVEESDVLISPDKSFTTGFYKVGPNAYCFSIWFTNSINKTVIWMANREQPVNGRRSRISLLEDGSLVLTNANGVDVWNTNTSSTHVNRAELLNSGNLVIKGPNGNILWQSFDSPTDTLLPLQPITRGKKLTSAMSKGDYSLGYFTFYFDNDNVLRLMRDGPDMSSEYWPSRDYSLRTNGRSNFNTTRYAVLDEMGRFFSSDQLQFNASDMGFGIRRRLTLDYDGNLRLYSLNESTGLWAISWAALGQDCTVHGLCGRYGICVYTPIPKCSCPPGFEMQDPRDWSRGCKAKFELSCDTQNITFLELRHTDYYGFDLNHSRGLSLDNCKKICLEDCSCKAFQYRLTGSGECYPKGMLFNGYNSPHFHGIMYVKQPKSIAISEPFVFKESHLICESTKEETVASSPGVYKKSGSTKYDQFYWFVAVVGLMDVLFIATGWWYLSRKDGMPMSVEEGLRSVSNQFRRFTYAELEKATKNFEEEIGRGGSGAVYKGVLDDKRVVGVKKLEDVIQGEHEFRAELSMVGRIYHMNLVRIWGYCLEGVHRLLVTEHVENRSLDKHLFTNQSSGTNPACLLGWKERFKIAVGTAKGLAYLHNECLEWVIHCDVKPENILLDSNFEPKIADFGLAKLSQRGRPGSNFSTIRGTKGYIAPEWTLNLPITAKIDVYSYGVVLLEIVKGSRSSNWVADGEEEVGLRRFVSAAKEMLESGNESWIEEFVDFRLNGEFNRKQAKTMIEIGISCVEEDRCKRPTMDMLVQTLVGCNDEPNSHIA